MLIGLYILTFYLLSKISGTIIFINPGSQECFSENVKGESLLFADFEVLSGSNFYIDAKVLNFIILDKKCRKRSRNLQWK